MGFWYYCQERCCGASAYTWFRSAESPSLNQYAGGTTFDNGFGGALNTVDGRPPLQGNPPSIVKQSDGWVLLRGNYGIRSDGSLWGAISDGRMLLIDAGQWTWVTQDPNNPNAGAGLKADGTLWTWNLTVPGDGSVNGWGGVYFGNSSRLGYNAQSVRAHIDRKMIGVTGLDDFQIEQAKTLSGSRTLSPSGLKVTLYGCEPNADSELTATVKDVYPGSIGSSQGGFNFDPDNPPSITFTPPGAKATAVVASVGGSSNRISEVIVDDGGTYSYAPDVRVGPNKTCLQPINAYATLELDDKSAQKAFTASIEKASVYYVQVTQGGSGYSIPPLVEFSPPGASAQAVLKEDGSVGFIKILSGGEYASAPTVVVTKHPSDTGGSGCNATAHIEGYISSVVINDPGSYTQQVFGGELGSNEEEFQAWCDPPPCVGHILDVKLTASGSNYLAPIAPQVVIGGKGKDAEATAVVDASGVVTAVNVTKEGTGYGHEIASVEVTSRGSGYTLPPSVTFDPASTASAEAIINEDGEVVSIAVTNGGVYSSTPPTVTITSHPQDETGQGCKATAVLSPPPTVTFIPPGAIAVAKVGPEPFGVQSIQVVTGGAYMQPTPPTVKIDSKIGADAEIKATVDANGRVSSLFVYSPGGGYDPEQADKAVPGLNLIFTPPEGGIGSGAAGVAYVISKYRHPRNNKRLFYDDDGEPVPYSTLRLRFARAVMSTGGIHSIETRNPIRLAQIPPLPSWGLFAKSWRISGGTGKVLSARGPLLPMMQSLLMQFGKQEAFLNQKALYEGSAKGTATSLTYASVYRVSVSFGGTGYTQSPTVEFTPPGATAVAVVEDGKVTSIKVTSGGSYTNPPSVTVATPDDPGGFQTTAVASVFTHFTIKDVLVKTAGSGYESTPTATVSVPSGVTAVVPASVRVSGASPVECGGGISGFVVEDGGWYEAPEWSGDGFEALIPQVTVSGGNGSGAEAEVIVEFYNNPILYPELNGMDSRPSVVHRLKDKAEDFEFTFSPAVYGKCRSESSRDFIIVPEIAPLPAIPLGMSGSVVMTKEATANYQVFDGTVTEQEICFEYDSDGDGINDTKECFTDQIPNTTNALSVSSSQYPQYTLTKTDNTFAFTPDKAGSLVVDVQVPGGGFETPDTIPVASDSGWAWPQTVFPPVYTAKLKGDWVVSDIDNTVHPGEFIPKTSPLPTLAVAHGRVPTIEGVASQELKATIVNTAGFVHIQGFQTVEGKEPGKFSFEPTINYSHNPFNLAVDMRQVPGKGWTGVECLPGACVATKGTELYWWGLIDWGAPGPVSNPFVAQQDEFDLIATPVRVGNSAIVTQTKVPPTSIRSSTPRPIEVSAPDVGWGVSVVASYEPGATVSGKLSSPYLYETTAFFDKGDFSHKGSIGYTQTASLTYHAADGSDPMGLTVVSRGPDGTAAAVIPTINAFSTGRPPTATQFAVIDSEGGLWRWTPAAATNPTLSSFTSVYVKSSTSDGFITKQEPCGQTANDAYAIYATSPGAGYTKEASLTIESNGINFEPEQYETEELKCGGGVYSAYYDPEGNPVYGIAYTEPCAKQTPYTSSTTHALQRDRHGSVVSDIGGIVYSTALPSCSVTSEDGSGFAAAATKLTANLSPGGWQRLGKVSGEAFSFFQYHTESDNVGITKSGSVRRRISLANSAFAGKDVSDAVSLSIDGKAAWREDGTLLVTDSIHAWVQGNLEMTLTASGAGLELPPQVSLKKDVNGVAKATATIDGKVVAFGVIEHGGGYTKQPAVEVVPHASGGNGAQGTAHICGPVSLMTVTNGGSKYRAPPSVMFSRPGIPAKAVALTAGGVDGVTITRGGSAYAEPPAVKFFGDGSGAEGVSKIKGHVALVSVTSGGKGYTSSPAVVFTGGGGSGAKAVAVIEQGAVSSVVMTNRGSGYTTAPSVTFEEGGGTDAKAQAVLSASVYAVEVTNAGTGYTKPPSVVFGSGTAKASASVSMSVAGVSLKSGGRYWNTPPTVTVEPDSTISGISLSSKGDGYTSEPDVLLVGGTGTGAAAVCKIAGSVSAVSVQSKGGGYSSKYPPSVEFIGGFDLASGLAAKGNVQASEEGQITGVQITSPGSGYRTAPSVSLRWPLQATAVANITAGKVTSIDVVNKGAFYAAPPLVKITGGEGEGAAATAEMGDGSVASISVSSQGSGYTLPPDVSLWYDTDGTGAALSASISATIDSVIVTSPGAGYHHKPEVLFIGGGGKGAEAEAVTIKDGTGASIEATINGRVEYIELTKQGSGYQFSPSVAIEAPEAKSGVTATAQTRILGKISEFKIVDGGSGYSETKANQTVGEFVGATIGTRPCQAIAMVHGVGYGPGKEYVAFGTDQSGKVTQAPSPPGTYYIQQPLVTFLDGTGVRSHATLSLRAVGVDHIGAANTGSTKQSLSQPWPILFGPSSNCSELAISCNDWTYGSLTDGERISHRPVWRGAVTGKDALTPAVTLDTIPVMSNKTKPTIFFENEKGAKAELGFSDDLTTGKARVTILGGENYLARYESGDTIVTLEGTVPLPIESPAKATTTIDEAGSVNGVTLADGGLGYVSPVAYVHGGGGTGAEVTFSHKGGKITDVVLAKAGSGYVSAPSVTFVEAKPVSWRHEVAAKQSNTTLVTTGGETIYPPSIASSEAILDFVEENVANVPIDTESIRDRTGVYRGHAFYDTGSVVDVRFIYAAENRRSPSFSEKHPEAPEVVFFSATGTVATAATSIVKWHPPVGDGMAIRDTTQ